MYALYGIMIVAYGQVVFGHNHMAFGHIVCGIHQIAFHIMKVTKDHSIVSSV